MRKFFTSLMVVGALALTVGLTAALASHAGYTLFGDAQIVSGGNPGNAAQIRSDNDPGFGGVSFTVAPGTTFGSLDVLSTGFMPQDALDLCVGGSPRFSIGIDTDNDGDRDGSIFAYFGVDSAGLPCLPTGWQNTGDFLQTGRLLDTSQLPGGTFYDPYDSAFAKYSAMRVTSISVVVDSEWAHADHEQTFLIDNTNVDGNVVTYDEQGHPATSDDCKNGGWMDLVDDEGNAFKNQGDCVSYANHSS
jgi:hypothetical protein